MINVTYELLRALLNNEMSHNSSSNIILTLYYIVSSYVISQVFKQAEAIMQRCSDNQQITRCTDDRPTELSIDAGGIQM